MTLPRVALYTRLPEIHRIKDEEQSPPKQLEAFLKPVEDAFGAIHLNIEALYDDLFIETCAGWVIPYIGDLVGTTPLQGDERTLRADVADTIRLRRRKGTLGAIELLTFDLTRWGVHCRELRESLGWLQHLNHQRPDEGGLPPYGLPTVTRHTVVRGGTATVRDPATLSLVGSPFDPFAYTADVRAAAIGDLRPNLPNLAIFLWRLAAERVAVSKPMTRGAAPNTVAGGASIVARFDVHPLGEPLRLFNTGRFDPNRQPPVLTTLDATPGPIVRARLTTDAPAGNPAAYVSVETYDPSAVGSTLDVGDVGLQLHVPAATFAAGTTWRFRGANLCAWESALRPALRDREIAIDPEHGRIAIGVASAAEGTALVDHLLLTYTYGTVGPVGAHPISRDPAPTVWLDEPVTLRTVDFHLDPSGLATALANIQNLTQPLVVEIDDSMVHDLDLAAVTGTITEDGGPNLRLNRTLVIRAASDQRPVIRLAQPLRARPTNVSGSTPAEQEAFDAVMNGLTLRLEGLYLTRASSFPAGEPLIARAALHGLEIIGCTLDPGGFRKLDGTRAPIQTAIELKHPYGFAAVNETAAFQQTPEVHVQRTVSGPLLIDAQYALFLDDSIVDAGAGVDDDGSNRFAVSAASDPANGWGPPTRVSGLTSFGRMRVERLSGPGGIWVHALEVLDNQTGCIKLSYFAATGNRLPQNHACVTGATAVLRFTSEAFGDPAYAQLALDADFRIRERGPRDDAMGAFGFLLEAHRWRNLQIRFREFMPVGVRPLLIPVT